MVIVSNRLGRFNSPTTCYYEEILQGGGNVLKFLVRHFRVTPAEGGTCRVAF